MQPPAAGDNARWPTRGAQANAGPPKVSLPSWGAGGAEPGPGDAQETAGAASFGATGAGATVWRSIGSSHLSTPWLDVSAHRRPPWECTMARLIASPA